MKKQWEAELQAGQMDSSHYPELGYTPCENGFAAAIPGDSNNTFRCNNVSLFIVALKADMTLTFADRPLSLFVSRRLGK